MNTLYEKEISLYSVTKYVNTLQSMLTLRNLLKIWKLTQESVQWKSKLVQASLKSTYLSLKSATSLLKNIPVKIKIK